MTEVQQMQQMQQDITAVQQRAQEIDWEPQLQCVHAVIECAQLLLAAVGGYQAASAALVARMHELEAELAIYRPGPTTAQ